MKQNRGEEKRADGKHCQLLPICYIGSIVLSSFSQLLLEQCDKGRVAAFLISRYQAV